MRVLLCVLLLLFLWGGEGERWTAQSHAGGAYPEPLLIQGGRKRRWCP